VPLRGPDWVTVDALGGDALPAATLDRVVDAQQHRAAWREDGDQEAEQQACRRAGVPRSPVKHPMVVGESPFPAEPRDPQQAGHGALARGEDGADQQQLGVAPGPLLHEDWREG
jgi:hypothetical protein